MSEFSLRKAEKLCSRTAVDKLFASGTSAVAYPLRWCIRFLTVPTVRQPNS